VQIKPSVVLPAITQESFRYEGLESDAQGWPITPAGHQLYLNADALSRAFRIDGVRDTARPETANARGVTTASAVTND